MIKSNNQINLEYHFEIDVSDIYLKQVYDICNHYDKFGHVTSKLTIAPCFEIY